MREQPRAVLDTNILVRAVLRPGGVSGQIFRAFRRRRFQLVTSPSLLDELVRVLLGPSVQRVADIREQDAVEIRANLEADAFVVSGAYRDVRVVPSDPTDDMLFAAALEARAPYIVSGDEADVRAIKAWKPFEVAWRTDGRSTFRSSGFRDSLKPAPPIGGSSVTA